jgi:copper transport protein
VRPLRRALLCTGIVIVAAAWGAGSAAAHAKLVGSAPAPGASGVQRDAAAVVLRFSEQVAVLDGSEVTVVDGRGRRVDAGTARTSSGDSRRVIVPLRGPLNDDSFTVRFRVVSDDSHLEEGAFAFAVGRARLRDPLPVSAVGISDTGAVAVAVRWVELIAFGLLLGLIVFRALVWDAVASAAYRSNADERDRALRDGRRSFWRAFWGLAALAGVAEAAVLVEKTAVVFHTGVIGATRRPDILATIVSESRFGDLLGWRDLALLALVGLGFVIWSAEAGHAPSGERRWPALLMAVPAVTALTLLASQGHASQAPVAPLSIAADAAHLSAAAIWIGGLPCLAVIALRAPRALPDTGRAVAAGALARFSRVAVWSVGVLILTGIARLAGELSSPAELWSTAYGRCIVAKSALLLPLLLLGNRNRRAIAAFARRAPDQRRLRTIARSVQVELAIALAIIAVAALLVAEVPG